MKNKFCCVSLVLAVLLMWAVGMAAALEHSDAHGGASAASSAGDARLQATWMWNVLVIPPRGGWETEAGKAISTALSWHEAEISESGSGAGGHDVQFDLLPPMDEDSALRAPLPIDDKTAAVMSFAGSDVDRVLVTRMAGTDVPLLLSGGEEVLFDEGKGPARNIFALDLYRDYRCAAFALYAAKTVPSEAHVALIASRFAVNQEREAKITYGLLDEAGFMPLPFWVDASMRNTFDMVSQEIESSADGVMISFLGSMGAREIWRSFMRLNTKWKLWNCAFPDETYLSSRGMIFADQNIFLTERGDFSELKHRIWNTRAMHIVDTVSAGRAEALTEWLKRGIESLPQPVDVLDHSALLRALETVQGIPFGAQTLDIVPETHRPRARQVYIAEVRSGAYVLLDSLPVTGLVYVPID
ncbi:MAG: hypothetical protein IJR68_02165 [Fretibacterium sp.]|nr:hypothetical protein [Fretibacterium sp.]